MKELTTLYKELQERRKYLEGLDKTMETKIRINENSLTTLRVQQSLLPLHTMSNKQSSCKDKEVLCDNHGLNFVFKTKEGEEVSACIPLAKVIDELGEEAFEIIMEPDCSSSSCAVNNFCECDPINEDAEFKHVELVNRGEVKTNKPTKRMLAEEIILSLDDYGRGINRVEYGLPIDPDTKNFEDKRSEEMLNIITNILNKI